ncbi:probable cytochrome P450 308a1 [Episyrphus balteatus]|uniref:probable cytochrome P450 308a1 n=1 Tax=Episyrphus balteatus TaxID=286459 RepID=UPI002486AC52|nr:probable cytochrome P450 308a1 [Episyrphus balteatus]
MLTFLMILGTLFLIVFNWIWNSTYWSRQGIKGPMGMPIFGNMFQYLIGRRQYGLIYEDIYKSYPKASYIGIYRVMNEPAILLRNTEMIKEIMVKSFPNFSDNVLYVNDKREDLVFCNPFIAKGEKWRVMRSELVPMFTPNKMKLSFPHIASICKKLDSFISNDIGEMPFEGKDLCAKYTLDVVASAAYGLDGESFTNKGSDFTKLVKELFMPNPLSLVHTTALLFLPKLGDLIQYRYLPEKVQQWFVTIISKVMSRRRELKDNNNGDFLQWLIDAKQKTGELVDEFTIIGHCSTLLIEGFETSASLMAYALYEFSVNPHIQKRVQSEIDEVMNKHHGKLSYEAILEMTYLDAALYETLRLHPPMLALLKHCTKPFELPPQFNGVKLREKVVIEEGTIFVVPVQAVHHDPVLFPDPHKFDPDRFSEENKRQRENCSFLGFGEGPRMCPGMRFGFAQSKAGLVTMLMKYNVQLSEKCPKPLEISPTTFLTTSRSGIWLCFKARRLQ